MNRLIGIFVSVFVLCAPLCAMESGGTSSASVEEVQTMLDQIRGLDLSAPARKALCEHFLARMGVAAPAVAPSSGPHLCTLCRAQVADKKLKRLCAISCDASEAGLRLIDVMHGAGLETLPNLASIHGRLQIVYGLAMQFKAGRQHLEKNPGEAVVAVLESLCAKVQDGVDAIHELADIIKTPEIRERVVAYEAAQAARA